MKIINDFLPEEQFKGLQSYVMGEFFPWWYNTEVDFPNDNSYLDDYQFTHVFYAAKGIEPFPEEESKYPDAVILDPSRKGLHNAALEWIEKLLPNQIIYVSCELKTLKRDLNKLTNNYSIRKVIPVDMFPHTKHVECIVSLEKIN